MAATANDAPILLLQWLGTDEYKETQTALAKFGNDVKIMHADVATKVEAIAAIKRWLDGNPHAQFLFIGTHGDQTGIGPTVANGVEWPELWAVLKTSVVKPIAVWLGACESSFAAKSWSPVADPEHSPVDYIVGFPVGIKPDEIEKVLHQLLKMTGLDPITYVDQEIPKLRVAVPKSTVQMHYLAETKAGPYAYVDFDQFVQIVGMTLKEYLEKRSREGRR